MFHKIKLIWNLLRDPRKLRVIECFLRSNPFTQPEAWTIEDAQAWSDFKTGPTGYKMTQMMHKAVHDEQLKAISTKTDDVKWQNGYACGVRTTIAELDDLLRVVVAPKELDEDGEEPVFVSVNR